MLKKIKRAIFGNDDPPKQLPIKEDYIVIGEEASAYEIKGNEEIPIPESNIVSKIKKIERKKHDSIDEDEDKIAGEYDEGKDDDDDAKSDVKIITQKIVPKLLTVRMKSPHEFENLKKIIDHDVIIINYEEISLEAFEKIFLDFKRYMETLNYSLWMVDDNVILIVKSEVDIDKYKSESNIAKQDINN